MTLPKSIKSIRFFGLWIVVMGEGDGLDTRTKDCKVICALAPIQCPWNVYSLALSLNRSIYDIRLKWRLCAEIAISEYIIIAKWLESSRCYPFERTMNGHHTSTIRGRHLDLTKKIQVIDLIQLARRFIARHLGRSLTVGLGSPRPIYWSDIGIACVMAGVMHLGHQSVRQPVVVLIRSHYPNYIIISKVIKAPWFSYSICIYRSLLWRLEDCWPFMITCFGGTLQNSSARANNTREFCIQFERIVYFIMRTWLTLSYILMIGLASIESKKRWTIITISVSFEIE